MKRITFIGSGNVATHLSKAFFDVGYTIDTILSKKKDNATELAYQVDAFGINAIEELDNTSDLYIIAIKDDLIDGFLSKFPFKEKLVVHTSGSVAIDVFIKNGCSNYGIFYPLQSFSKEEEVIMNEVPFCIEGASKSIASDLFNLAKDISSKVYLINSTQRKQLHLAAVFACNFSNHMYTISEKILKEKNLDYQMLKPLILATAKKATQHSPQQVQTGPAKRKDNKVIQDHIELLANSKEYQAIYKMITQLIIDNN